MTSIFGKTLAELKDITHSLGLPGYSAKQIAGWMYQKNVCSIDDMTDLSKSSREKLKEQYVITKTPPLTSQKSADGTIKYLFKVGTEQSVEAVFIPEEDRATLCISSQIGCMRGCTFCMTAQQGFMGNLSTAEILNQIMSLPEYDKLTNIVYMGMGEPMDNIEAVLSSIDIITSGYGMAWSYKRVTVSTVGITPGIKRLLNESKCHLAISLHSPFDEERKKLMPVQRMYPIRAVIDELKLHDFNQHHRVSFEYIVFKGINDTSEHAEAISRMLSDLSCRVNLIKYHSIPGKDYEGISLSEMERFRDLLNRKGIIATIRRSRGEDIFAACGLLSTRNKNMEGQIENKVDGAF